MPASALSKLFGNKKPVIAMAHVPALPGTPRYDADRGMGYIIEKTGRDLALLLEGGVDAVMFCNEDDRPYLLEAAPVQVAAMARVVAELAPKKVPFGVDFLFDPIAALSIAVAAGASFVREVVSGAYESDMGVWSPRPGEVMRLRHNLRADNVLVFYNITPEFGASLGTRSAAERAHSAAVSCLADAILVSGPMAGTEPDLSTLRAVKEAVGSDISVLLNTGAKPNNIAEYLPVADGVIVGSSLKVDGYTWNPVDPDRLRKFMETANRAR